MDIQIIPAIDIIDGKCVRLTQGDYGRSKVYHNDVLDVAKQFADSGYRRLHMVDLDGAKASEPRNLDTLERVASGTGLDIQFGGGIKSAAALDSVFSAGASRAICGSIAVKSPDLIASWIDRFGHDRIILGADINGGKVAVHGWTETVDLDIDQLISRFLPYGLSQVICTDISKDGMLCGPSVEFYAALQSRYPGIAVTVSGGISSMADIEALDRAGLRSVIVGKAFYEGRIQGMSKEGELPAPTTQNKEGELPAPTTQKT